MTILKTALRIYAIHLLSFTIGAVAGSVQAFVILASLWHAGVCR